MLKRYQVLMNDWLADFTKSNSKKYDISFSEGIRIGLCLHYLMTLAKKCPDHTVDISTDDVFDQLKNYSGSGKDKEELQKTLSKIYFETRKLLDICSDKNQTTVENIIS